MFCESRINHKDNTINGQRGLCNVGGHHDFAPNCPIGFAWWSSLEYTLLEVRGKCGVERDALQFANLWPQILYLTSYPLACFINFLGNRGMVILTVTTRYISYFKLSAAYIVKKY